MMTRAEHIEWCKTRALAELADDSDREAPSRAMASMTSDLRKHPETSGGTSGLVGLPPGVELAFLEALCGGMRTSAEVRAWIEGYQ